MTDFKSIESIRATERNFNLDAAQDEVTQSINAMAGWDSGTFEGSAEPGVNGDDNMSTVEAVATVKLQSSPLWTRINDGIRTLLEQFQATADNEKLSHDARITAADKILGVKAVQAMVGGLFAEANQVVDSLKKEDVRALGTETAKQVKAARAAKPKPAADVVPGPTPRTPKGYTAEELADNTAKAQAFLSTLPKRTN